jgi:tyrosyl-tRNA synthetase
MLIFTDLSIENIDKIFLENKNINDIKTELAYNTTIICRGLEAAENAKKQAETIFIKGELDIQNAIKIPNNMPILDLLVHLKAVSSKGEARKLIANNGIKIDDITVVDAMLVVEKTEYFKLSIGKKKHFTLYS